jgi:hypothetical protein
MPDGEILGWDALWGCMWPAHICIYCPVTMSTLYVESLSERVFPS